MKFKIALLQITAFGDDQEKNLSKGLEACREVKALGADLAVFPELWSIRRDYLLTRSRRTSALDSVGH